MWKNKRIAGVPISTDSFRSIKQAMKDISRKDYADDDTILHRLRICVLAHTLVHDAQPVVAILRQN